ncbi:MAG: SDH family Clp fold serine proteinase [Gammaproteobacteria bacterium]
MPSWSELRENAQVKDSAWLNNQLISQLGKISKHRNNINVILYGSAFLQKPESKTTSISREDMNGFMNAVRGMDCAKGLGLVLHTPGGDPNAAESIVDYLHKKFEYLEVIIPYLAMSAGSMISLASDLIIMGKQSQLGPIDPQMIISGKVHSARAIKEGFDEAKSDIEKDTRYAHLWAPILQAMAPSLFLEANKALQYSQDLVEKWLGQKMLAGEKEEDIKNVAKHFNADFNNVQDKKIHVHGQRIDIDDLNGMGLKTEPLEQKQELQNAVLTVYHLMTLTFEQSAAIKMIISHSDKKWIK